MSNEALAGLITTVLFVVCGLGFWTMGANFFLVIMGVFGFIGVFFLVWAALNDFRRE